MITFEQWWGEYCVKHHFDVDSAFERALHEIARDTFDKWFPLGVKIGCLYEEERTKISLNNETL